MAGRAIYILGVRPPPHLPRQFMNLQSLHSPTGRLPISVRQESCFCAWMLSYVSHRACPCWALAFALLPCFCSSNQPSLRLPQRRDPFPRQPTLLLPGPFSSSPRARGPRASGETLKLPTSGPLPCPPIPDCGFPPPLPTQMALSHPPFPKVP